MTYADVEIHILKPEQDKGYPVEIRVDGLRHYPRGYLQEGNNPPSPTDAHYADQTYGQKLFAWFFADPQLDRNWAEIRGQGRPRRIRLFIDAGQAELAKLHRWPWEALWEPACDSEPARPLASDPDTPFSRYLAVKAALVNPISRRPIRILVAAPRQDDFEEQYPPEQNPDMAAIDPEAEFRSLQEALQPLLNRGAAEITLLPQPCTLAAIADELSRARAEDRGYQILHLISHGFFENDQASLLLADADNHVLHEAEADIVQALRPSPQDADDQNSLRLLFLASCESASRSSADAFRGLAPSLVQAGLPAVLAMQAQVDAETARLFALKFYQQLLRHGQVDLAANEARQILLAAKLPGPAIPVLFMRLKDGRLFVPTSQTPSRRPFMARELPADHIPRSDELRQLANHLLDEDGSPRAVTVGLHGFGGYGKTALACAICHDERVVQAFSAGILWATIGEEPTEADLVGQIRDLIAESTGAESPDFAGLDAARTRLIEELGERRYLLVVDDVWNEAHLRPFLQGGPRCARLVTTRIPSTLPPDALKIDVGAMQPHEAAAMLGAGLPQGCEPALGELAARLGEWPLLLRLVNGTLRHRIDALKQALPDALTYVNTRLERKGLTFFDAEDPVARDQAVAKTVSLSLDLLTEKERARYEELAIFPKAIDIPLPAVANLWRATGGLDDIDVEDLCDRLFRLSLLQAYNLKTQTIRLHDVLVDYLVGTQRARLPALQGQFLDSYGLARWQDLPADEPYLWRQLAYHLVKARREPDLRALLLDFDWLRAKLGATDVTALVADYHMVPADADAQLVGDALRLSAHVLARDPAQLPGQLLGRLLDFENAGIQPLLEAAHQWRGRPWLRPLTASLTPPGGPLLRTLAGHNSWVDTVAVYDGGRRAISASADKTLIVWDLERGQALHTLAGHSFWVDTVAVYDGGRRAISASWDGTLRVWDLECGQALHTLEGHTNRVFAVAVYDGGQRAISASGDRTLKVWDLESGQALHTLAGHTDTVKAVAVYDGGRAISASADKTLKVWDLSEAGLATGQALHTLEGHTDRVAAVEVCDGGGRAISASWDKTIIVWDLESGQALHTLEGHTSGVNAVALYDEGRRALSASADTLIVWDLESGQALHTLEGHSQWVDAVVVYDGGRRAISASWDNIRVWDLERGQALYTLQGHTDLVTAVAVYNGGRRAISASHDRTLKVWDLSKAGLERSRQERTLEGHTDVITAVAVYDGDRRAISASRDNTLKVWDLSETGLERGRELHTLEGHTSYVQAVAVDDRGRRALSASSDQTLKVWDLETGRELRTLGGHTGFLTTVAVYDGGRRALSASTDDTLQIWDLSETGLERGREPHTLEGHSGRVTAVAVYNGERRAISASRDNTLRVWDLETGQALHTLEGHGGDVTAVAVYDEGRRAISTSHDNTLKVWDLESGQALHTLEGHSNWVNAVAVYDGGRRAVSASWDKTLKVWDLSEAGMETGQALKTLEGHTDRVTAVAVCYGGRRAVSTSTDHTLKVWDLEHGRQLAGFTGEGGILASAVALDGQTIVAGDGSGRVHFLRLEE